MLRNWKAKGSRLGVLRNWKAKGSRLGSSLTLDLNLPFVDMSALVLMGLVTEGLNQLGRNIGRWVLMLQRNYQ